MCIDFISKNRFLKCILRKRNENTDDSRIQKEKDGEEENLA